MPAKKEKTEMRRDVAVVNAPPETGLTMEQVLQHKTCRWSNGTPKSANRTEKEIILENTLTFFNLVFVVLALILVIGGSSLKNMTFLVVVICNTCIGCYQEIRAKRAVDRLTLVAAEKIRTVRDGEVKLVRSDLLVRDDIVEFGAGDQICADGILRAGELQVNESLITGEADVILKRPGDELKSGSFVVAGTGRVQLTHVGADAFAAKLAAEAKADPMAAKSEMMLSLDKLIRVVGIVLIPVGLMLFYKQYSVIQLNLRQSVEGTVSALVGMIPEGLYLLTSVAMAVSALKLTKKKVLVQDMNCIETIARVDVLCVDKTGTITESRMEADNLIPLTDDPPERLEQILAALYSNVEPENETARAMAELYAGETNWECLRRIPFTSQTKWSAATFRGQGTFLVGAPEFMMGSRYEEYRDTVEAWSGRGYRVIMIAQHTGEFSETLEPGKLRPLALALLTNRIRANAPKTFEYFAKQGVEVKVISGDHPATVSDVACRAGIPNAEAYVDASQLETDDDFYFAAANYTVFGRVTPDQKKKLIHALKEQGHTVAMTGDGVNDVLAMRESDCGIAMAGGAQAASQIAQLVLLKSDFAAMPSIVGEGRRVINNIQRAAILFLVKNIFSVGLAVFTLFTGWPYPLMPLHLTLISSLTIGIPSFFLAMEPNYERVKGRFITGVLRRALPGGLTNIFVVLMAQTFMAVFTINPEQISTACAALLAFVGMLVLLQVCQPFDRFRKIICIVMGAGLVFCFTVLHGFFELNPGDMKSRLVLFTLTMVAVLVFVAMTRLFHWGEKLYRKKKMKKN